MAMRQPKGTGIAAKERLHLAQIEGQRRCIGCTFTPLDPKGMHSAKGQSRSQP